MSEAAPVRDESDRGPPPPRCKAILLCEKTITDARTGHTTLISLFTHVYLPAFPGRIHPAMLYLLLTDGIGKYRIMLEVHDLARDRVLSRSPDMEIEFPDRRTRANVNIAVPPLLLHHPGLYDVVALANGREIDRAQFEATTTPARRAEPPPGT